MEGSHIQHGVALLVVTDIDWAGCIRGGCIDQQGEVAILPRWQQCLGVLVHTLHVAVNADATATLPHRVGVLWQVLVQDSAQVRR